MRDGGAGTQGGDLAKLGKPGDETSIVG